MKVRVFYHSSTGNTKKVAEAIAETAGCRSESVTSGNIAEDVDLLFLGGAVYATHDHGLDPAMKKFIASLDPRKIGRVVLFRTGFSDDAISFMKGLLESRGMTVSAEYFGCKGKLFWIFNHGHPDAKDLKDAQAFARRMLERQARQTS